MVKDEIREKETILCGKCPDLKIRHHFGRKAVKGAIFIAEIRDETVDVTTVPYQAATEVHFARIQRCGIYNAGFESLGGIWNGRKNWKLEASFETLPTANDRNTNGSST
ncbi:hypothetical protein Peur_027445 [Populus x canadensis]